MQRLRTVTSLDVSVVAGHHAMPAALLFSLYTVGSNFEKKNVQGQGQEVAKKSSLLQKWQKKVDVYPFTSKQTH